MSDTLRDQLLGLGFKPVPKPDKPPRRDAPKPGKARQPDARVASPRPARPANAERAPHRGKPRSQDDIDLAKAYAIRAQREKDERIAAERAKQEEARLRREARTRLAALVEGKTLNDPDADIARHFDYGGKIKRVYVNVDQLKALNVGELGVLQLNGRYVLVAATVLTEAEALYAPAVALKVDPQAAAGDDPYADPQYQVPDDLVW